MVRIATAIRGLVVLGVVAGCSQQAPPAPPPAPPPDSAAVRAELDQLWSPFRTALLAADTAGALAPFADEVRIDFQGFPPMVGRGALESQLKSDLAANVYTDFRVTPIRTTVYDSVRAGQYGTFSETFGPKGKPASVTAGRFAAGYGKGPSGWQVRFLIGFPDSVKAVRP